MTSFDVAYEGTPTWDIGRPQPAVVRLVERGRISGRVLDAGCGTGENAIYLAGLGYQVVGVDFAGAAIARARAKAEDRGVAVEFIVGDALRLGSLGRTFATALDVGLFHSLRPERRVDYAASLAGVVAPGGFAHLLCWSWRNPFGYGPERIRRTDVRRAFGRGWVIEDLADETLDTLMDPGSVHALLASIRRKGPAGRPGRRPGAGA